MNKTIISKFNTQGALRISQPEFKTSGLNGGNAKVISKCSDLDDPFVSYAYDYEWNVSLQKFVHSPVFECGYVE